MKHVQVFNRAINAEEVEAVHRNETLTNGLIVPWSRFSEQLATEDIIQHWFTDSKNIISLIVAL